MGSKPETHGKRIDLKSRISKRTVLVIASIGSGVIVALALMGIVRVRGSGYGGERTLFGSNAGTRCGYSFRWESDSSIDYLTEAASLDDDGAIVGARYDIYTRIEGDFETRLVATHHNSQDVAITFSPRTALLEVNGSIDERSSDELAGALSRPIVLSIDKQGRILSFGVRGSYELAAYRNTIASILANLEFIIQPSPDDDVEAWTTTQHDASGPYVAEYRVLENSAKGLEILKVKTGYTERELVSRRLGVLFPSIDTRNHATARYTKGRLESAAMEEVQLLSQGKRQVGITRYSFQAQREWSGSTHDESHLASTSSGAASSDITLYALYQEPTLREVFEATHIEKLAGRSAQDVLAELDLAEAEAARIEDYKNTDLMASLRALAFLNPESSGLLAAKAGEAPVDSLALYYIPDALLNAGHAQAQSALCDLVTHWQTNTSVCSGLIPYLGLLLDPGPEAVECVRGLCLVPETEIAWTAGLNLGLMAASLRIQGHEAEADRLVGELRQRYASAADVPSRARSLRALGNAQAPSTVSLILEAMRDEAPDVRASAAYAARFQSDPSIDEALRTNLANDSESIVRLSIVTTLGMREPDDALVALYSERLQVERSGQVKTRILDNLYAIVDEFPLAVQAIARTAMEDRDQDIRDYAAYFLERLMQEADSVSPAS